MIPLDTTTGTTSATKWLSGLLSIPLGILLPLRPLLIVLVAFIGLIQLRATRNKEVQQ